MKKILVILMCTFAVHVQAQEGVAINNDGASPDASSILDLKSTTKGILIPRMTESQRTLISNVATGLLVYQTDGTSGFYFYSGSGWESLSTGSSGWNHSGNAGTTNGTDFIGTIDAQDLDIRTNNVARARITQKGQIETLNTGNSVFIGEGAGANDDLSDNKNVFVGKDAGASNTTGTLNTANGYFALYSNTTGYHNTANGYLALYSNTTGTFNTANGARALYSNTTGYRNNAIGSFALYSNTTGTLNTANGYYALYSNTTGYHNTANGYLALYSNTTGTLNTANGYYALYSNTTGNNNTALGSSADVASGNLTNATAIGYDAEVDASNKIQLGNTSVTSVATSGALTTGAVTYPNTDGTPGQVMTTDGAGVVSFQAPSFSAQDLTLLGGNTLWLTNDATTVDLSPFLDNTDNQNLTLTGNTLSLTNDATTVDLSAYQNNTLNEAYNAGGAGAGRIIFAVNGTVAVTGEDGLVVTGTLGSGLVVGDGGGIPSGAGARMFFNPSRAAFRAGYVTGAQWDNANIGAYSTAMGKNTYASGDYSTAMGSGTIASGFQSTAMGNQSMASGIYSTAMGAYTSAWGNYSTAMGYETTASGLGSTAMGIGTNATGNYSTAMGSNTTALCRYETAIGRYNTSYAPADITNWFATDRLFVVGNGTGTGALASNALTIYANGTININDAYDMPTADGTPGQVMTTDGAGVVSFQTPGADQSNTLDEAYDEGGAGAGRQIDANDGAFRVNGDDGFIVTGTYNSGDAIEVSGAGTRMFFNPNKAAFRAGYIDGTQWDDANIGNYSTAMGYNTTASGSISTAMGSNTMASGLFSTAIGSMAIASGNYSTAMGTNATASEGYSTAMGTFTAASGVYSTALGTNTSASGSYSSAMGANTSAPSGFETAIGRYNTNYTPASTITWNSADRLFVIGNGTGSGAESNALIIYKNGTMNINDAYDMPTADGTAGQVMTTDGAGVVSFQSPSDNQDLSLSGNTLSLTNDATTVDLSGYMDNTDDWTNSGNNIYYDNGSVGIGTSSPNSKLHVNNSSTATGAHFRVQDAGNTKFCVANNGYTALYYNDAPSYNLQLNANSAAKPTSSVWTVSSDARLKTNVSPFSDGLNVLMAIDPVWFEYNGKAGMPTNERGVGTIAQELQKIAPYMVNEWTFTEGSLDEKTVRPDGPRTTTNYLGVDYGAMDFIVINSIQEQQRIIENQKAEIDELKAQMIEMQAALKTLTNKK